MQFVYPLFLGALALLAIPILIHLFYFRRYKKVLFSNVRFLKEIKEESSIRSRLKNLLILLCRLLAVALLVLGFAQPFLKQDAQIKKGRKAVSLFIDNSFSMASLSQDAPLMEEAKKRAIEIVSAYDVDDEFQIISHDLSARQQRLIQKDQAVAIIEEIALTPEVSPLSRIMERQKQLLAPAETENRILYFLSDFQENITDLDLTDTTYEYNLVQLQAVIEKNVSIDSAWFEAPVQMVNKPNRLFVKIRNWSEEGAENLQLSMRKDGAVKPLSTIDIAGNSVQIDTVMINVLKAGNQEIELRITDFPITFDDNYFVTFDVKQKLPTLSINESGRNVYLEAAFSSSDFFDHKTARSQNLDYGAFNQNKLIVVSELRSISSGLASALKTYMLNGGNVLLFPQRGANQDSYSSFFGSLRASSLGQWDTVPKIVNFINRDEFVFNDVFESRRGNLRLPSTQGNFKLVGRGSGYEKLLTYRNGRSYMSKFQVGTGNFFLCSAPLDDKVNSLVLQAEVFVPMLYKMALSSNRISDIAYTIGEDNIIEIENQTSNTDVVYKMRGRETFIPGQQSFGKKVILNLHDQISEAGFYDLYLQEEEPLTAYAFNANRLESDPACVSPGDLATQYGDQATIISRAQLANVGQFITERDKGISLWKYCLILALIFLALETLIIRFWRPKSMT